MDEDELPASVNEHWTVAAVFGHIAFSDARVLSLAIASLEAARLALPIAEETDVRVATLPEEARVRTP